MVEHVEAPMTSPVKARKPQILKGFRDHLPRQMILRQRIMATVRDVFERHGFEPLDTPAIEYLEVLSGKAGENEKLMYHFADQGDREVGLRYDLTVPLARVVAMHQSDLVLPFKRYHMAPVWRSEKPQRGRFREFWQCDADIVGSPSMLADAQVTAVMIDALSAIGLPFFTIRINHRRLLESLARSAGIPDAQAVEVYRIIDKLDKIGSVGVSEELERSGTSTGAAKRLLDLVGHTGDPGEVLGMLREELDGVPGAVESVDQLAELFTYLRELGVPPDRYALDLALARGLDYYTGPVFEATVEEPRVGSVAGAGRYDGLIGTFLGRPVPATGMSLGLERIIEVVEQFDLLPTRSSVADVFVPAFPDAIQAAATVTGVLRGAGLRVDQSVQPHRSVGEQLKYAGRKDVPVAVIVGAAESVAGVCNVKDLRTGIQETCPWERVVDQVRSFLEPKETGA